MAGLDPAIHALPSRLQRRGCPGAQTSVRSLRKQGRLLCPGMTATTMGTPSPLLLRLPLLDRAAGVAPGGEAAAHMGDRLQAHVLRGLGRERRTHTAGAVEDELLVLLEDRLGIWALRSDPEFQHAVRARARSGALAL